MNEIAEYEVAKLLPALLKTFSKEVQTKAASYFLNNFEQIGFNISNVTIKMWISNFLLNHFPDRYAEISNKIFYSILVFPYPATIENTEIEDIIHICFDSVRKGILPQISQNMLGIFCETILSHQDPILSFALARKILTNELTYQKPVLTQDLYHKLLEIYLDMATQNSNDCLNDELINLLSNFWESDSGYFKVTQKLLINLNRIFQLIDIDSLLKTEAGVKKIDHLLKFIFDLNDKYDLEIMDEKYYQPALEKSCEKALAISEKLLNNPHLREKSNSLSIILQSLFLSYDLTANFNSTFKPNLLIILREIKPKVLLENLERLHSENLNLFKKFVIFFLIHPPEDLDHWRENLLITNGFKICKMLLILDEGPLARSIFLQIPIPSETSNHAVDASSYDWLKNLFIPKEDEPMVPTIGDLEYLISHIKALKIESQLPDVILTFLKHDLVDLSKIPLEKVLSWQNFFTNDFLKEQGLSDYACKKEKQNYSTITFTMSLIHDETHFALSDITPSLNRTIYIRAVELIGENKLIPREIKAKAYHHLFHAYPDFKEFICQQACSNPSALPNWISYFQKNLLQEKERYLNTVVEFFQLWSEREDDSKKDEISPFIQSFISYLLAYFKTLNPDIFTYWKGEIEKKTFGERALKALKEYEPLYRKFNMTPKFLLDKICSEENQ